MSKKGESYKSKSAMKKHEKSEGAKERKMEYGSAKAKPAKIGKVMKEFKAGTLHSGKGGPKVTSRKQAVAIAMSEAKMAKKKAAPKGYHRMPDGKIMKGAKHK